MASISSLFEDFKESLVVSERTLAEAKISMKRVVEDTIVILLASVSSLKTEILTMAPFSVGEEPDLEESFRILSDLRAKYMDNKHRAVALTAGLDIFEIIIPDFGDLEFSCSLLGFHLYSRIFNLESLENIWNSIKMFHVFWKEYKNLKFASLNLEELEKEVMKHYKQSMKVTSLYDSCDAIVYFESRTTVLLKNLPLMKLVRAKSFRPRHWDSLKDSLNLVFFILISVANSSLILILNLMFLL